MVNDHDVLVGYDACVKGLKAAGQRRTDAAVRKKRALNEGVNPDPVKLKVIGNGKLGCGWVEQVALHIGERCWHGEAVGLKGMQEWRRKGAGCQ
jgi:hypothetical protein